MALGATSSTRSTSGTVSSRCILRSASEGPAMSQDLTEIDVEGIGIMRLPNAFQWERIKAMPRGPNKAIAPAAFGLGLTVRQFKNLPVEKQREAIQAYYKLTEPPIPEVRPGDARRRIPRKNERVPEERMIELGRELLAIKARLPKGHFMPWIEEKS
ncbi:hypothetical protein I6F11_17650, partial [Ensifer sp. NBAIM29]|nr:hypothetical protein [Ensifer sp. NBAIM29]